MATILSSSSSSKQIHISVCLFPSQHRQSVHKSRSWEKKQKKNRDVHVCMSIRIPKTQPLLNLQFTLVLMWNVLKCWSSSRLIWMMQFSSWMRAAGVLGRVEHLFLLCCRRTICYLSYNRAKLMHTGLGSKRLWHLWLRNDVSLGQSWTALRYLCLLCST